MPIGVYGKIIKTKFYVFCSIQIDFNETARNGIYWILNSQILNASHSIIT